MKLLGIEINGDVIWAKDFWTDSFLWKMNSQIAKKWTIPTNVWIGIQKILSYKKWDELEWNWVVEVYKAISQLWVRAIVDWDIHDSLLSSSSWETIDEIRKVFIYFEDYRKRILEALDDESIADTTEIVWNIWNWKYDIYKYTSENWTITFHIFESSSDEDTIFVDDNWKILEITDIETDFYFLAQNWEYPEIWYGNIKNWFDCVKRFKWWVIDNNIFYARDVIWIFEDDMVSFENLQTWREIFRLEKKFFHSVIFITWWRSQSIVYRGYIEDDDGKLDPDLYMFITDENNVWDYSLEFQTWATIFRYIDGIVLIEFDEDTQTYNLFDSQHPDIKITDIQCFRDLNWRIYYNGDVKSIPTSNGHKYFLFSKMDEEGNIVRWIYSTDNLLSNSDVQFWYEYPEQKITH